MWFPFTGHRLQYMVPPFSAHWEQSGAEEVYSQGALIWQSLAGITVPGGLNLATTIQSCLRLLQVMLVVKSALCISEGHQYSALLLS